MSNSVPVRFTKAWRTYFPGDIAGFDQETAATLIGGGVATAYAGTTAAAVPAGPSNPAARPAKKNAGSRGAAAKTETVIPAVTDPLAGALNASGTDDSPPDDSDSGGDGSQNEGPGDETQPADQSGDDDEKP